MKKKAMKKWIPKDTLYCGGCKWWRYICTINYHRNPRQDNDVDNAIFWKKCKHSEDCNDECWSDSGSSCRTYVCKCEYLGFTDFEQDSLLWEGCKECGAHYPKEFYKRKAYR